VVLNGHAKGHHKAGTHGPDVHFIMDPKVFINLEFGNITHNFIAVLVLQTCMGLIRPMQDKAYKMYNAGAYLHQYKQFGIDKQDFDSCFARIEDTYASYQAL